MRAACALIHLDAITRNLARVRELAPTQKVMAIVKADGYGHGLERVVRSLAGADAFGVASIDDAERIRALGLGHRIVLLSGFDELRDLATVRELKLDCVLHDATQLQLLAQEPNAAALAPLRIWVKFDSGMTRLGFSLARASETLNTIRALPQAQGEITLMTHFAQSDEEVDTTDLQIARFDSVLSAEALPQSFANSAATLRYPLAHRSWVRPGGILYGLSTVSGKTGAQLGFQPAMSLLSKLIAVKEIPAGAQVGYGGSYVAPHAMRIGIASIGYGDGYPRHVASGTLVLVGSKQAQTIGRVSMDLLTLDLTNCPDAQVGTDVLLWGAELPAELIAERAGTLSYELTCGVTRRVRFLESG